MAASAIQRKADGVQGAWNMSPPVVNTADVHHLPHGTSSATERLRSIDLARGMAVVLMIATHAAHAFLADTWKDNEIWFRINILFGFVAPAFVLLSGLTLWPALQRRMERGSGFGSIARRYLTILLLGYWLQTPVLSLRQLIYNHRPDELARMFDANVLQVIAISGLLVLALARMFKSPGAARAPALLLALAAAIAAPYLRDSAFYLSLPLPFRSYLAPQPAATIPLIPYLAYFASGFAAAPLLIRADARNATRIAVLAAAALLMAAGFALGPLLAGFPPHNDFWGPGVQQTLFRLGGCGILIAACMLISARFPARGEWLIFLGRRSLAVYMLHLMLIYGSPMSMGMRYWYHSALNGTLGPVTVMILVVVILLLCYGALCLWDLLRERSPVTARRLAWLWWGLFWGLFLVTR